MGSVSSLRSAESGIIGPPPYTGRCPRTGASGGLKVAGCLCLGSTEGGKRRLGIWRLALRGTSFDWLLSMTFFLGADGEDALSFLVGAFLVAALGTAGVSCCFYELATGGGVRVFLAFFLGGGFDPFSTSSMLGTTDRLLE